MAGAGYRNWTAGDIPTATQFDTFLQEQTVMSFASASARDTALASVKSEGMVAYLLDTNRLTVYTGSAWSTVGTVHGGLTSWTPTVTQSGSVAVTVNRATYQRSGRWVDATFRVTCTGTGSASNAIIIGGLPFTAAYATGSVGSGGLYDVSAPQWCGAVVVMNSTTTLALQTGGVVNAADPRMGLQTITVALASGDVIDGTFHYEAAADA